MSETSEITEGQHAPTRADPPYGEQLTPEQYETLRPMLQLADLGRTEKLTEKLKPGEIKRAELKRRAIDALREHGTIGHAAAAAGVSPRTIYTWRDADPAFNAAVTEFLHVDLVDTLVASAYKIATSDDPKIANAAVRAQEMLLKAYDPDTFTERQRIEQTVTVNQQVQIVHTVRDTLRAQQAQRLKTIDAEPTPRTLPEPPTD